MDERHHLLGQVIDGVPTLERLHFIVSEIRMHDGVPQAVREQFNIARNMALYTYFMMTLAPEVQFKTFRIIEQALRIRANASARDSLKSILDRAETEGWLADSGFRHIASPSLENVYCIRLFESLRRLRNNFAHGGATLTPDSAIYLSVCADFVNQLFAPYSKTW